MIRKVIICLLTAALLTTVPFVEAQQAGKVYRIGYLRFRCGSLTTNPRYIAFRQGLRELGYVEGQNLVLEYRCADSKPERRPVLAAELVRLKVDVIVVPGAPGYIRAVQGATRTIPIVLTRIRVDPVKAGFVDSLRRPGGNITGITNLASKLHAKRLELLKEAFPQISRVAILWSPSQQKQAMKEVKAAGQALGIQIQSLVRTGVRLEHLERFFSAISRERADGLLVTTFGLTRTHPARIIEFTVKRRLPTIYGASQFVKAGGLMSYSADHQHLSRRVASYIDKILKGAKPADLPIEQPTKFELIVNLKAAKQIGITFPPAVLYRADKVIK